MDSFDLTALAAALDHTLPRKDDRPVDIDVHVHDRLCNSIVNYTMATDMPFSTLIDFHCRLAGYPVDTVYFLVGMRSLDREATPSSSAITCSDIIAVRPRSEFPCVMHGSRSSLLMVDAPGDAMEV